MTGFHESLIDSLVSFSGVWVAGSILILGVILFPTIRFDVWTIVFGTMLFLFYVLEHIFLATVIWEGRHPYVVAAPIMLALHLGQAIGISGLCWMLFKGRLVVQLECRGLHYRTHEEDPTNEPRER